MRPAELSFELDRQHSVMALQSGLQLSEKIRHNKNGNRSVTAATFLKKIKPLLPRVGVTRMADISFLAAARYPVFQSTRPNCLVHTAIGQNTSSQGKGPARAQALVSCAMEALERYCAEPRNPHLIRASYDYLKNHQLVFNPKKLVTSFGFAAPKDTDPIMWTQALHVESNQEILVPAEIVYFPFLPKLYQTNPNFPCSTNGLSSGATYLEAVIHGLYEVVERYYHYLMMIGEVRLEALFEDDLNHVGIKESIQTSRGEFELQLYSLEIRGPKFRGKNLPFVMCLLVGDQEQDLHCGMGCSATVAISMDRAISEALQCHAAFISGGREDLQGGPTAMKSHHDAPKETPKSGGFFGQTRQPENKTLRIKDFRKRVHDLKFKNLRNEYEFIVDWIHKLGFKDILLCNLTRVGVDIPVVKAIIPGMELLESSKTSTLFDHQDLLSSFYPNIENSP